MRPSEQHERWRLSLLGDLKRRLSGCIWCGFGLRRQHFVRLKEPYNVIVWFGRSAQCATLRERRHGPAS